MKIKNIALATIISFCTIPAYGMEENNKNDFDKSLVGMLQNFARQSVQNLYKNIEIAEKKEKFKSTYNKNFQFMYSNKVNNLTTQEKNDLLISLQESNQLIKECYGEDTLSEETGHQCDDNKQLIKELERHLSH